jgi:hypothetical protein
MAGPKIGAITPAAALVMSSAAAGASDDADGGAKYPEIGGTSTGRSTSLVRTAL